MKFNPQELHHYMSLALETALNDTSYNIRRPHVGAVIVSKDKTLIGRGSKGLIPGTRMILHAERVAIYNAESEGHNLRGTYLFTTLEPCIQQRNNQVLCSCSKLIVNSGLSGVVIALTDNSPTIHPGDGIRFLKNRGIDIQRYKGLNDEIYSKLMNYSYNKEEEMR